MEAKILAQDKSGKPETDIEAIRREIRCERRETIQRIIAEFDKVHSQYRRASMVETNPENWDDDQAMLAASDEKEDAARKLFMIPAQCERMVWTKIAIFENYLYDEHGETIEWSDGRIHQFFGCIKADLASLRVGTNLPDDDEPDVCVAARATLIPHSAGF